MPGKYHTATLNKFQDLAVWILPMIFAWDTAKQPAFTCSKLKVETCEQGVFIANFEHVSYFAFLFLLLALSR